MPELKHTGVRGKEGKGPKLIVIAVCAYVWSYLEAHDLGDVEKAFSGLQFGCGDKDGETSKLNVKARKYLVWGNQGVKGRWWRKWSQGRGL